MFQLFETEINKWSESIYEVVCIQCEQTINDSINGVTNCREGNRNTVGLRRKALWKFIVSIWSVSTFRLKLVVRFSSRSSVTNLTLPLLYLHATLINIAVLSFKAHTHTN